MRRLVAIMGLVAWAGQADAATVTREFTLAASGFSNFFNEPPPFTSLTASFRVTYDAAGNGFMGAPDRFSAVTSQGVNAGPFSATPGFGYLQPSVSSPSPRIAVGGELNGVNVQLNRTDDFFFSFDAGVRGPTRAMLSFTTADDTAGFIASDAIVTPVAVAAGVPEPTAWAVMLLGFGVLGVALRQARTRALGAGRIAA